MNRSLIPAVAAACILSLPAAAGTRPWTIDDVLSVRTVTDPQVSPDGRWAAYVISEPNHDKTEYNTDIWLVSTDGGEPRRLTSLQTHLWGHEWTTDGDGLVFGNEGSGAPDWLHEELHDWRLTIPHANPDLRSLNLSTAAGEKSGPSYPCRIACSIAITVAAAAPCPATSAISADAAGRWVSATRARSLCCRGSAARVRSVTSLSPTRRCSPRTATRSCARSRRAARSALHLRQLRGWQDQRVRSRRRAPKA